MERDELSKLTLTELRTLAERRGIAGADKLRREALVAALEALPSPSGEAPDQHSLFGRARQLVKKAAELAAERLRGVSPPEPRRAEPPLRTPTPGREPTETETMARLYEEQGHLDKAIAIYRKLSTMHPERTDLLERIEALESGAIPEPRPSEMPTPLVTAETPHADNAPPPAANGEPLGMLDFEELPERYGVDDVMAMWKDPHHIFVYWEVTPEGRAAARSHLGAEGHAAKLILRLASARARSGGVEKEEHDIELDWDHGRRYLPVAHGSRVSVAVGLRSPSGDFAPIAHSAVVHVPPAEPGPDGPVEWMEVAPNRRRGGEFEAISVVVRGKDGKEQKVRGLSQGHWDEGAWHHPGSRMPVPPAWSSREVGSSWIRQPRSSEDRPTRGGK
jgi:hypothetical protein